MFRFRRTTCTNCPIPIDAVSPSPETPKYVRSRFARFAPVATEGMRPWTELNPCEFDKKYAGDFDEQPIPESFATLCGSMFISQHACTIAALIESCPHPAQRVDSEPS